MQYSRYNVWSRAGGRSWVFNPRTGALIDLTAHQHAAADRLVADATLPELDAADTAVLETLVRAGILRPDGTDEVVELEREYGFDRLGGDGIQLTIVASLGCNFDCPYCFEEKSPSHLRPEVCDAIVDMIRDSLPAMRRLSVTWFGGEPLLAKQQILDLSDRLIALCDEHDAAYSARMISNGWHLSGEVAAALAERRVDSVQVTLDGPARVHDLRRPHRSGAPTFERIAANVDEAIEHLDVSVRVNLTEDNLGVFEELVADLAARGLAGRVPITGSPVIDQVSTDAAPLASFDGETLYTERFYHVELEVAEVLRRHGFGRAVDLPTRRSLPCAVVTPKNLVIGPAGELWKCWDEVGDTGAVFGSIFHYQRPSEKLRKWGEYSPFDDAQCRACIALPVCMGGCPHIAFTHPDRSAQCGTFRFNHQRKVDIAAARAAGVEIDVGTPILDGCASGCGSSADASPATGASVQFVTIGPTRRAAAV